MSEIELKACPFCGGDAERVEFGPGAGDNEGGSCVACTECGSSGPVEFGYKENFVSTWNARPPQWQPIETAPRDGTEILAWDGQGQATISWKNGRWSLVYAGWRAEDGDFDAAINWQPLPAPPEVVG